MAINIKLFDNSDEFQEAFEAAIEKSLEEIGLTAEANAKLEITKAVYDTPESPSYKRTGRLRNSISHTDDGKAAYIGTNVEYAPYVELGTSRMGPRPYLKPAVLNHVDEYKEIVRRNMKG